MVPNVQTDNARTQPANGKQNIQSCASPGLVVKPTKWNKLGLTQPVRVFLLCAQFCAVCVIKIIEKGTCAAVQKVKTIKNKRKKGFGENTHELWEAAAVFSLH